MTEAVASSPRKETRIGSTAIGVGLICASALAFAVRYHFARPMEDRGVGSAIRGVEDRLRPLNQRWAEEVRSAEGRGACAGAERAATRGLDADLGASVLAVLERAKTACPALARVDGMRAEALARSGQLEPATRAVTEALRADPHDPFALYGSGLLSWRSRNPDALDVAQRAVDAGRGRSALVLKGLVAYDRNLLEVAEAAFQGALREDPEDVEALYDLALVRQRQSRYLEAREGYLKVLRLRPAHADSRFNLGVLAHSIGAKAEAQHHLEKLREAAPNSGLVSKLEAILAQPAEPEHGVTSSPHYSLKLSAPPARSAGRVAR